MKNESVIKLEALEKNVSYWLRVFQSGRANNFDPKDVMDLFTRFDSIGSQLRTEYSTYFAELPTRQVKPSQTPDCEGRGYIERKALDMLLMDINYCIDTALEAQILDESPVKATREGLFFAGQYYDAIRWVSDIISNVQKKVVIIDRFFNEKTLDLLCAKNQKAKVEVLTEKVTPPLKVKAAEFNKQYGQLEIRLSSAFHDRFIIVDDTDFYHLGASIEHLGSRGFMFSRIEEPVIIRSLSNELTQEWKNAKVEIQP